MAAHGLPAIGENGAQLVEFGVESTADHAGFIRHGWRFVGDCSGNDVADIGEVIQLFP